jgi:hypothetical protein
MTSAAHYRNLEEKLQELLAIQSTLKESDRSDVLHFIDVGEYGLALETLVGALIEDQQKLPTEVEHRVRDLAVLMDLADSPVVRYLGGSGPAGGQ